MTNKMSDGILRKHILSHGFSNTTPNVQPVSEICIYQAGTSLQHALLTHTVNVQAAIVFGGKHMSNLSFMLFYSVQKHHRILFCQMEKGR